MDMQEDVQEDSGWKLVHGDVFRPPKHTLLLSVLLGSGSQLFMMVGATTSTAFGDCSDDSLCLIRISLAK